MTTAAPQLRERALYALDRSEFTAGGHRIERHADGTATVFGVAIFRSGTFRDSMGDQSTWTDMHLEQMAAHFELLRSADIFPDVPVRRDHSWSVDKVMGYIEKMYVEAGVLRVDVKVTEPDQVDKLARGTYRSVSNEVGMYVDNSETPYWPVVMGFAYVDIPAVEGLHAKEPMPMAYFSRTNPNPPAQETPVTTQNDDKGASRPVNFRINNIETNDAAAIQNYINELEKRPTALASFRVAGVETTDVAAVQAHIEALEGFQRETAEGARKNFVAELVRDNKIVAPMQEAMEKHALALDAAGFEAFKAIYAAAPAAALLANHGAGSNPAGGTPAGGQAASEKMILEDQLRMHRDAGMSEDEIKNTKAYKRLADLNGSN